MRNLTPSVMKLVCSVCEGTGTHFDAEDEDLCDCPTCKGSGLAAPPTQAPATGQAEAGFEIFPVGTEQRLGAILGPLENFMDDGSPRPDAIVDAEFVIGQILADKVYMSKPTQAPATGQANLITIAAREYIQAYNFWMAIDSEGVEEENRRIRVADEKMDVLGALVGVPRYSFGDKVSPEMEKTLFAIIRSQAPRGGDESPGVRLSSDLSVRPWQSGEPIMDADDLRDLIQEYADADREYHSIPEGPGEKGVLEARNEAMHNAIDGFVEWVKYARRATHPDLSQPRPMDPQQKEQ